MNMVTTGDDARALFEHWNDAAELFGRAGQGDNWYAVPRTGSAIDEIELATNATIQLGTDAICADLASQVDLDGGVDSHLAFVLGDHKGIVDVFRGMQFEERVIFYPLVHSPCADTEDTDALP